VSSPGPEVADWRSEWDEADRLAESAPTEALAHYDRATARLLEREGYQIAGTERSMDYDMANVARGLDPEVVFMYMEAHAILNMQNDGRTVGAETMALAFEAYRTVREIVEEPG
jgi:hypothetical protein